MWMALRRHGYCSEHPIADNAPYGSREDSCHEQQNQQPTVSPHGHLTPNAGKGTPTDIGCQTGVRLSVPRTQHPAASFRGVTAAPAPGPA